jgi:hypothetical protein
LSDAVTSAALAEHYRTQAEMCYQMARMTVSPFKEGWLEFADEWTKLARETEARAPLERQEETSKRMGRDILCLEHMLEDSETAAGESFPDR